MAGLYVHIPFCASRCIYCGFYSTLLPQLQPKYVDALVEEMKLRKDYLLSDDETGNDVGTIYIGGGTPSQLKSELFRRLMQHIYMMYGNKAKEVTIEVNPDDVTLDYARFLVDNGVNRVSMGVQTFNDDMLRFLRRRHSSEQVKVAVRALRKAGINNISIDLMYGLPNETLMDWKKDLIQALSFGVEHISAYSLMYEKGTALYILRENNKVFEDEELNLKMYEELVERLVKAGYDHYEISNFAHPGRKAIHNSGYWNDTPYIGLGAAAHSYNGVSRQWNVADIKKYIAAISHGEVPAEIEKIDDATHYNDLITTALRTSSGLELSMVQPKFKEYLYQNAQKYIDNGKLELADDCIRITKAGIFVSDMIMSDLVYVD